MPRASGSGLCPVTLGMFSHHDKRKAPHVILRRSRRILCTGPPICHPEAEPKDLMRSPPFVILRRSRRISCTGPPFVILRPSRRTLCADPPFVILRCSRRISCTGVPCRNPPARDPSPPAQDDMSGVRRLFRSNDRVEGLVGLDGAAGQIWKCPAGDRQPPCAVLSGF